MIKKIWAEDIGKLHEAVLAANPDHLEWLELALELLSSAATKRRLAMLRKQQGRLDEAKSHQGATENLGKSLRGMLNKA